MYDRSTDHHHSIVLLDELDHIAPSSQSLDAIFNLFHQHSARVRLISIANTHTLTSSSTSTLSAQSLSHVKTCHFAPYTPQQLLDILEKRLSKLSDSVPAQESESKHKFLPPATLTLLSKKIAAQTGDVRALFEVLRRAIDIAAVSDEASSNPLAAPTPSVAPAHILAALKAYSPATSSQRKGAPTAVSTLNNEMISKVQNLGLQARLVLLALMLACRRISLGLSVSGATPRTPSTPSKIKRASSSSKAQASSSGVDVHQLHAYYVAALSRSESEIFTPVSRSEFGDLIGVLETVGLVSLSASLPTTPSKSGRRGLQRTSSFASGTGQTGQSVCLATGIRLDEVSRGLGIDADSVSEDVRANEVRAIADKERARMMREARAEVSFAQAAATAFEGAVEN